MKRRDFITVTGKSALLATMTSSCLVGENVPNSRPWLILLRSERHILHRC